MLIDKSKITGKQFMFTVACFVQSSILLTSFMVSLTLRESWMIVLFASVCFIPFIWTYRKLMVMFPDKNLMQILEAVYGKVVGKFIGALYAVFFLTLTSLNVSDLGEFLKVTSMPETPGTVLVLVCLLVSALAVRYGISVVTRYGAPFVVIMFGIVILASVLVSDLMNVRNFFPMFELPFIKYVQSTHILIAVPFGELVIFLMIRPNVKMSGGEVSKYLYTGVGLGFLTLLIVLMRDIAVQGSVIDIFTLPGLVTLRLARIGKALSRIEILFVTGLIMLMFFKVTVLLYATIMTIAQLMNLKRYRHLILAMVMLILSYGATLYSSNLVHLASAQQDVPFTWSFFELLIPIVTVIVAKLRKLPKAKEA
jgi:spore germination protein KB